MSLYAYSDLLLFVCVYDLQLPPTPIRTLKYPESYAKFQTSLKLKKKTICVFFEYFLKIKPPIVKEYICRTLQEMWAFGDLQTTCITMIALIRVTLRHVHLVLIVHPLEGTVVAVVTVAGDATVAADAINLHSLNKN